MTNELWYPGSLSLFLSHSLHFTLYRLLKYSPIPSILNTPSQLLPSLCSFHLPVCRARSLSSPCCPLSCTIHLANLIFGVDRALNRGLCFHTHLSPSLDLSFLSHSLSPFRFPLPLFFRVAIMKSSSSPSSVLAAFAGLRETNSLLILCLWFVKLTDICII